MGHFQYQTVSLPEGKGFQRNCNTRWCIKILGTCAYPMLVRGQVSIITHSPSMLQILAVVPEKACWVQENGGRPGPLQAL